MGKVRNIARKGEKDRYEIHFPLKYKTFFPYGCTQREGQPIKVLVLNKKVTMGFHQTTKNEYLWLSTRLKRDGYDLTDLLLEMNFSSNEEVGLSMIGKDHFLLTKLTF